MSGQALVLFLLPLTVVACIVLTRSATLPLQMLEQFLRNRGAQNQQQAAQKQHLAQFGMGAMNPGASSAFHDPSPQGFPHNGNNMQMGGGNANFNMNTFQAMAARNPNMGMLQSLQGGGSTDLTRQINMLGMAHNQRTQDQAAGNPNFAAIRQMQSQPPQQQPQQPQPQHQLQQQPPHLPPQQQPPLGAHMNAGPSQMGQGVPAQMSGQPQPQPGFFGPPGMSGAQNGLRNSPPQMNMQAASGMRPPGAAAPNGMKLGMEDLKNRALMVNKAVKELEQKRMALMQQGGQAAEFEANGMKMKIMEHQQLLQRITRMMQMTQAGIAQNGMPGPDASNV